MKWTAPDMGSDAPAVDALPGFVGAIAAGLAAVALYVAAVLLLQRGFLYFPQRATLPAAASGIPGAVDVVFGRAGETVGGWFVPPRRELTPTASLAAPKAPAVLVMNGNAGHRGYRAALARALSDAGFAVLLYDHPGYGDSAGSPTEVSLLGAARLAADFLGSREGVNGSRMTYFGESLGAGVAVALATERPPAALVLRSPFTSVADMSRLHYPLLPLGPLLLDRYDSVARIADVRAPVLVIAGERDRIVPLEHSRLIHDAAPGPKRFVVIPGADHNDRALLDGAEMVGAIEEFLRQVVDRPR